MKEKLNLKISKNLTMYSGIFLLTGLLLLTANGFAQDPNFYIYLCFGQSNMEGQGTIEQQDRTVDSRFQVMQAVDCSNLGRTKGNWYPAVPPLCRCWNGLCPADYFGRTMVTNLPDSIRIGVINVSVGGCRIELFDKDIYQDYDSTYTDAWFLDIIKAYDGNPYAYLIDLAKQAQEDGVIKGILLHQGESNTGDNQWPSKVLKIYEDMTDDLDLDPDSTPLLAGEVVSADQGGVCASMNSIIAKLPQTLPNSYVISSSGCTAKEDNLHFNSAGYRELGKRYAVQMLSLMGYETDIIGANPLKDEQVSVHFSLHQNYPNPFNPATQIEYRLKSACRVNLAIYNMNGRLIKDLINEYQRSGEYSVHVNMEDIPSGVYFYKISMGDFQDVKKMVKIE